MKFCSYLGITALAGALTAPAQLTVPAVAGQGSVYTFGTITTTGQLGRYLDYSASTSAPANYTVDWSYTGTKPSVCSGQLEGSSDAVHWFSLTGAQDCTSANAVAVTDTPWQYQRFNVLAYAPGDGTTAVTIRYTKGGR